MTPVRVRTKYGHLSWAAPDDAKVGDLVTVPITSYEHRRQPDLREGDGTFGVITALNSGSYHGPLRSVLSYHARGPLDAIVALARLIQEGSIWVDLTESTLEMIRHTFPHTSPPVREENGHYAS